MTAKKSQAHPCNKCKAPTDPLSLFPGGICIKCHEIKFNAEVQRNGGMLPRPNFRQIFTR